MWGKSAHDINSRMGCALTIVITMGLRAHNYATKRGMPLLMA